MHDRPTRDLNCRSSFEDPSRTPEAVLRSAPIDMCSRMGVESAAATLTDLIQDITSSPGGLPTQHCTLRGSEQETRMQHEGSAKTLGGEWKPGPCRPTRARHAT